MGRMFDKKIADVKLLRQIMFPDSFRRSEAKPARQTAIEQIGAKKTRSFSSPLLKLL